MWVECPHQLGWQNFQHLLANDNGMHQVHMLFQKPCISTKRFPSLSVIGSVLSVEINVASLEVKLAVSPPEPKWQTQHQLTAIKAIISL